MQTTSALAGLCSTPLAMAGKSAPAPVRKPAAAEAPGKTGKPGAAKQRKHTLLRELGDELTFVFLIVMFFKLFIVDLYKIPSGSMTATLIGGRIAEVDANNDGRDDIVYWSDQSEPPLVYLRGERRYVAGPEPYADPIQAVRWLNEGRSFERFDRILVNKLAYWLRDPRRGEIVVFKVPEVIFDPAAPIYIKRLVGEPGDQLTFDPSGRLIANGQRVVEPVFFAEQLYRPSVEPYMKGFHVQPNIQYGPDHAHRKKLLSISVPTGEAYVFGDNTHGSLDSRYWGGVPIDHFKGRAFMRVFPLTRIGFLK